MSHEWVQRLREEKLALDGRLGALFGVLLADRHLNWTPEQQELLEEQFLVMWRYSRILSKRIRETSRCC